MSEQKAILTQDEIVALNEVLQNLAANLKLHVNSSLSSAHGINAQINDYFDGVGDKFGNATLIFEFGTAPAVTRLFVPAKVTTLGPARTTSGINLTATGPTGTFLSPGIPLAEHPLVTEFTEQILEQATIYNDILLAHANTVQADTGAEQAHGGTEFTPGNVLDSLGHIAGRYSITMGINGITYQLPADTSPSGPPQPPRSMVLTQNPTKGFTHPSPLYYQHYENRGGGKLFHALYPSGLTWLATAVGTAPITFTWHYYPLSYPNSHPTVPSLTDPAWVAFPVSGTDYVVATRTKMTFNISGGTFTLSNTGTNSNFNDLTTWIRVTATNGSGSTSLLLRFRTHEDT